MNVEQLALLGIVLFGFMAVVNLFNTIRTYKRYRRMKPMRIRRLVGGKESARAVAESLIKNLMAEYPDEVDTAKRTGRLPEALETRLEEARAYYLNRVEPIHKTAFNELVDTLILHRGAPQADD